MSIAEPISRRSHRPVQRPDAHWKPSEYAQEVLDSAGLDLAAKAPSRPRCSRRNAALLEMIVCEDLTLDEVGKYFDMTRERVRQILVRHTGLSIRDLVTYRVEMREVMRRTVGMAKLYEAAEQDANANLRELVEATGLTQREIEQVLGVDETLRRKPANTWTGQTVTDGEIMLELARVAEVHGGTPLAGGFYDEHRGDGSLSRVRIIQRFGTWCNACAQAGVATNKPVRSSYARRWTEQQLIDWAVAYVIEAGTRATYAGMTEWLRAKAVQGAPSSQTIRNGIGGWLRTLERALVRKRELKDGGQFDIPLS